jgi:hypothetical protein
MKEKSKKVLLFAIFFDTIKSKDKGSLTPIIILQENRHENKK